VVVDTIEKMLKIIVDKPKNREFIERHRTSEKDFIRNRTLSFSDIVNFVIGNTGMSLDFEVMNFCEESGTSVSAAAVSKARSKVSFRAFEDLFQATAEEIPSTNTFNGYRLTAFDGMKGELPKTKELMSDYSASKRDGYPQFHAVAAYDVLNCCYTKAVFKPGATDERKAASEILSTHDYTGKEIFLLDRGFPSLKIIYQINSMGKNFVMRVSGSFLREVNEFTSSGAKDAVVHVNYDKSRSRTSRVSGVPLPYEFNLRCVMIPLGNGKSETLVTNLSENEFSLKEIGELYNLRWKIETGFLHLKYAVCVEDFIGIKENSIKQEFFASLMKANIFMQFVELSNQLILHKKTLKHEYKTNIRKAIGILRTKMLKLMRTSCRQELIDKLVHFIAKFKSVIKPNRSFPRNFTSANHSIFYKKPLWFGNILS